MVVPSSMKWFITCSALFLLALVFIVPPSIAEVTIDTGDQVWYDEFEDKTTTTCWNCENKSGEIILVESKVTQLDSYDQIDEAYGYSSVIFFQFLKFRPIREFISYTQYLHKLVSRDDIYLNEPEYGYSRTRCVVQHFRIKIDKNKESYEELNLEWWGKKDENKRIFFYFWNSSRFHIGAWEEIKCSGEYYPNNDYYANGTIEGGKVKYAIGDDSYIDISVVLINPTFKNIQLSTNYIIIHAKLIEGFTTQNAYVEVKNPIDLVNISRGNSNAYWNFITWEDYKPEGTNVTYHIYYNNKGRWDPIPNKDLPQNIQGFTEPPVYLTKLSYNSSYNNIKIHANLNTSNPSVTPHIYSWAITWQNKTGWRDSFNTTYKIDQQTKMNRENNSLCISLLQDEWPVIGFDSCNTRSTTNKGPKTYTSYWYSSEEVDIGGGFCNPVVGDGKVYILSNKMLYVFNVMRTSNKDFQYKNTSRSFKENVIFENSPALSEDLIVVASGKKADGGFNNIVYGLNKGDLSEKWRYEDDYPICFYASPMIAQEKVYISSWGGDNGTSIFNKHTNNKIIVLDLATGSWRGEYTLPDASYSTPAVSSEYVIVGCRSSPKPKNDSIFAFRISSNLDKPEWSKSVGSIGRASPVIDDDKVFVTCEEINDTNIEVKIRALDLKSGEILWNRTIAVFKNQVIYNLINPKSFTDSTPALYNQILYVASPNGSIYAINTDDGSIQWIKKYYYYIPLISSQPLKSSPAYADGLIYFGTPLGKFFGIDAINGEERLNNENAEDFNLFNKILGSPIVSNGLVFISYENNKLINRLNSIGKYDITATQGSTHVISHPIRLPENLTWKSFQARVIVPDENYGGITFQLLDEKNNILLKNMKNGEDLQEFTKYQSLRLGAYLSTTDSSKNDPHLFDWSIMFTSKDSTPPVFLWNYTIPQYNGTKKPTFTIQVQDLDAGLLNNSARYTIRYTLYNDSTNATYTYSLPAQYLGDNESKGKENITANLTEIPDFDNIKSLVSIKFTIKDCVNNQAYKIFSWPKDTKTPVFSSSLIPPFTEKVKSTFTIKVQDTGTGLLIDSAKYTIRYILKNGKSGNYTNASAECFFNGTNAINGTKQNINMIANLSKIPNFDDIAKIVVIEFSIMDCAENKAAKSFTSDDKSPEFRSNDTIPSFTGKPQSSFSVKVRDNGTGLCNNSARYMLYYVINNKTLHTITPLSAHCTGANGTTSEETITANLTKIENFKNITFLVNITFYIKDLAEYEAKKTYSADNEDPYIYDSTTPPFNGVPVKEISVKARDTKSGLRVSSASYKLQYIVNNLTLKNYTSSAQCTGADGTTDVQNITANLTKIPFYSNTTGYRSIEFSVEDIAGNTASRFFTFNDTRPPESRITNKLKSWYNATTTYILINATANDSGTNPSGVQQVKLYYRESSTGTFTGNWIYFANSTKTSPQWKFNFTNNPTKHGGYFELCTIAIDKKGNTEIFPQKGDVSCIYDWTKPYKPDFEGNILWFKEPSTTSVMFEDDFRLNSIQYQPNFTTSTWTTIIRNINESTYEKPWSLENEYWNQMAEGKLYKLYFKINDTVGNILILTSENQAIIFAKDTSSPNGTLTIPDQKNGSLSYNFTIEANVVDQTDGSGIKEVSLYYRFSEDNKTWDNNWTLYGTPKSSSPFKWNYYAQEGDGYYRFKIEVTDIAGNIQESPILNVPIFPLESIPMILIITMIGLLVFFAILSITIFIKYRKTNAQ